MEIKIKWIKRKQMTHENTYRDDTVSYTHAPRGPTIVKYKYLILSYLILSHLILTTIALEQLTTERQGY